MLSFFPRGVLDEILNLIESVSEDFPSYSYLIAVVGLAPAKSEHLIQQAYSETFNEISLTEWEIFIMASTH